MAKENNSDFLSAGRNMVLVLPQSNLTVKPFPRLAIRLEGIHFYYLRKRYKTDKMGN